MAKPSAAMSNQNMLPFGKRAKNACSIGLPSLWQHYLVAISTSLDKLDNHHLHVKRFHMVKNIAIIRLVFPEIFDKIRLFFGRFVPDVFK